MTEGAREAHRWLHDRGLASAKRWYAEIALATEDRPASLTYSGDTDTRFHLNIYSEEWGVFFCHGSRASWVRVTDQPFVHGRDDHQLLSEMPSLAEVGTFLRALERRYLLRFRRDHALVRSNVAGARGAVRAWLATL